MATAAEDDAEVRTVALYGSAVACTLLLLSRPGRLLARHLACSIVRRGLATGAGDADAAAASPGPALPSPFGPPPLQDHDGSPAPKLGAAPKSGSLSSLASLSRGVGQAFEAYGPSPLLVFGRFLRVGDFEIIRDVGSDAALYLRFQRMAIKLLLPMSLVCIFVLAPLHARAGEPSAAADGWTLHATTAHNLPPHSWVLWLDVGVCYAFSLAVFRFIYHFQRDILGKFNSIEARTAATACTALVRHLPRRGVDDSRQLGERVQAHLQRLYGARSVVSCVAVPRVRPLFLLERRRKVLAERAGFLARQDHRGRCARTLSGIVRSLHDG